MGPCENAIALSRINRIFHIICKDHLTYGEIVKNGNGWPSTDAAAKWWRKCGLDIEKDSLRCAKWALADSKAWNVMRKSDILRLDGTESLSSLTSLLISGRTFVSACRDA